MKPSKALGVVILVLQLASVLAFGLAVHAMVDVSMNMAQSEALVIEMEMDEASGQAVVRTAANPRNGGLLGLDIEISLGITDDEDNFLASDSTQLHLEPGEEKALALAIQLPVWEIQERMFRGEEVFLDLELKFRTLYDLVSVKNVMKLPLGEQR
jgi:hypothetical protein